MKRSGHSPTRVATVAALVLFLGSCVDRYAFPPVRVGGRLVQSELGAVSLAQAQHRPFGPVIVYSDRFLELGEVEQAWVFAHEICHLSGTVPEVEADCCAWLWASGSLSWGDPELSRIVSMVQQWPASNDHPPGPERAYKIMQCDQDRRNK